MINKLRKNLGFTLIELLVVVAIIGILASVVLASLNTARAKAVDAVVKANLTGARAQAQLFYEANGNKYMGTAGTADDVCHVNALAGTDVGIYPNVLASATTLGGVTPTVGDNTTSFLYNTDSSVAGASVCHSAAAGWAAMTSLKNPSTAGYGWCVDSTGAAKETDTLTAGSVVCGS